MSVRLLFSQLVKKISYYFQIIDYAYLLPASTHLPIFLGLTYSRFRGIINFIFDLDWRSLSLGQRFVRRQTGYAISVLRKDSNLFVRASKVVLRFVVNSREEWEACYFANHSMQKILANSTISGLEDILQAQKNGQGVILLTPHFDSYCTGMVLMGMVGMRVNAMKTDAINDPRINPAIRKFFTNKYSSMEQFFNGGRIIADTENKRFFYQVLRNKEFLVIGADLPAVGKTALDIPFLGAVRKMAPGPMRLAKKTNSLLAGFVCLYQAPGKYHLEFSPLYEARDEEINKLYQFLDNKICEMPERWWASDLFCHYK